MTTSRSSLLLLVLATPLAAQDVALPSGQVATLFDVVLEDAATGVPLARADPEADPDPEATPGPGEPPEEGPLDAPDPLSDPLGAEAAGGLARFRLVLPGLGRPGALFEDVAKDLLWLCESLALPALAANGWRPAEVVVSLSDREVPFGATDPEAVQFFEGFQVEEGACVPQAF